MPGKSSKDADAVARRARKWYQPFRNAQTAGNWLPWRRILLIVAALAVVTMGTVAGIWQYKVYRRRQVRLDWARNAVDRVKTFVQDEARLTAELEALNLSAKDHESQYVPFYSHQIIVTGDGKWLAYEQVCSKRPPGIRDLFIAYSSDGQWYYSTCHFCVDMIGFGSWQESQPHTLQDLLTNWRFMEFDGNPEHCLDTKPMLPDVEAIMAGP